MSAPTITTLAPALGVTTGGTTVTVTGTGFFNGGSVGAVSAVLFGATSAASFTVVSDTQLTAVTQAGTGTVGLSVTTPGGTGTLASAFAFIGAAGSGYDGYRSTYTQGYGLQTTDGSVQNDQRRSRAMLSIIATGPDNIRTAAQATSAAFLPSSHPADGGLQAQSITSRMIGNGQVLLHGHYGPKQWLGIHTSRGHADIKWYLDVSSPVPYVSSTNVAITGSQNWRVYRTTYRNFHYRQRLYSATPPSDFSAYDGYINTDSFALKSCGVTFLTAAAGTLRFFAGCPQQTIAGNSTIWIQEYIFSHRADTWCESQPAFNQANPTTSLMFSGVAFGTALSSFPMFPIGLSFWTPNIWTP